jgi:hypothetical protein
MIACSSLRAEGRDTLLMENAEKFRQYCYLITLVAQLRLP